MTENSPRNTDVAEYAAAVRAACADLSQTDRATLLEDLEDHLAEVSHDSRGAGHTLADRLGQPAEYAAELRASAGLPAPGGIRPAGVRGELRDIGYRLRQLRTGGRRWLSDSPTAGQLSGFLLLVRSCWWVLRAYAAVVVLAVLTGTRTSRSLPVPELLGSEALGWTALTVAVMVSVWLGGRLKPARPAGRALLAGANTLLLVAAVLVIGKLWGSATSASPEWSQPFPYPSPSMQSEDRHVSNIYPYDADGRPLTGVFLYDQNGKPFTLPDASEHEFMGDIGYLRFPRDQNGNLVENRFPLPMYREGAGAGPDGQPGANPSRQPLLPPSVGVPSIQPIPSPSPSAP